MVMLLSPQKDERKKAVEMKMFGRLTRQRYEWHPDRVLCKRFNVANPYPESLVPGVPGGTRRETFAGTDFLNQSSAAAVVESATEVDNSTERGVKLCYFSDLIFYCV